MSQIFIFTAVNPAARQQLDDSIINPVSDEKLAHAPKELADKIVRFQKAQGGVYAWGAEPGPQNESRWKAMQPGDIVLCVYDSHYHFVAEVLDKIESQELIGLCFEVLSLVRRDAQFRQMLVTDANLFARIAQGAFGKTIFPAQRIAPDIAQQRHAVLQQLIQVPKEPTRELNQVVRQKGQ